MKKTPRRKSKKKNACTKHVGSWITEEEHEALSEVSDITGVSNARLVRQAVASYLVRIGHLSAAPPIEMPELGQD